MSTRVVSLGLTDGMRSLAESQLQMQAARSAALDGGALGVVAVDAAVATLVVDTGGTHHFWVGALVLLGLSLGVSVQVLRSSGAKETGPSIMAMRRAREIQGDNELGEWLLDDLAEDVQINDRSLARKALLFNGALMCLVLAIVIEIVGKLQ
jgi:hypothetical protein